MEHLPSIVFFLLSALALIFLPFFRLPEIPRKWLIFAWVVKLAAAAAFIGYYNKSGLNREVMDAYRFFDDSRIFFEIKEENPEAFFQLLTGIGGGAEADLMAGNRMANWNLGKSYNFYNDNRAMIRLNALLMFFSGGDYFFHVLFFCFLSFAGSVFLFKTLRHKFEISPVWVFAILFFWPGLIFWTSGVLKESPLWLGAGMFFYGLLSESGSLFKRMLVLAVGTVVLLMFKIYFLLGVLFWLPFYLFGKKFITQKRKIYFSFVALAGLVIIFSVWFGSEPFRQMLSEKQRDFILLGRGGTYLVNLNNSDTLYFPVVNGATIPLKMLPDSGQVAMASAASGFLWQNKAEGERVEAAPDQGPYLLLMNLSPARSFTDIPRLMPEKPASLFPALAHGLFNVFFRPHPLEWKGVFQIISGLETILLLLILIFLFPCLSLSRIKGLSLFFFFFFVALTLLALPGIITPVLGALVRYKVPLIPLFIFSFFALFDLAKARLKYPRAGRFF